MSYFASRGRGRGYYGHANSAHPSQNRKFAKFVKLPQKAANPINQYYMERFTKMKRDADMKNM